MTFGEFDKRIQVECDRYIPKISENSNVKSRLRWERQFGVKICSGWMLTIMSSSFVNIGGQGFDFGLISVVFDNFPDYYSKLVRDEPIQCRSTGLTVPPALLPPTCVLTDVIIHSGSHPYVDYVNWLLTDSIITLQSYEQFVLWQREQYLSYIGIPVVHSSNCGYLVQKNMVGLGNDHLYTVFL